jgi:FkbM family methyltransferase
MKAFVKSLLSDTPIWPLLIKTRNYLFPASSPPPSPPFAFTHKQAVIRLAEQKNAIVEWTTEWIAFRFDQREIRLNPRHEVYGYDMINYFDYYHAAVVSVARDGVELVDYSKPAVHVLGRSRIPFYFPSLPESDESTEAYMEVLGLKQGQVVLDCGAYAGASAYFLSKAVGPDGLVISFEPDAGNFKALVGNIERHGLENVIAVNKGVWSSTGSLQFQAEGNMGSSAVSILGRESNVITVEVLSLDDAASLAGGRPVNAIKMDIEGAELEVIEKCGAYLKRNTPNMIIEPHVVNGAMNTEILRSLLSGYGYETSLKSQGVSDWFLIKAQVPN